MIEIRRLYSSPHRRALSRYADFFHLAKGFSYLKFELGNLQLELIGLPPICPPTEQHGGDGVQLIELNSISDMTTTIRSHSSRATMISSNHSVEL
jgi:hypothetical protein